MDVRFTKGPASVLIADNGSVVERGQTVSVPDDLGEQLVAQGWEQVQAPITPKTPIKEKH